MDVTTHRAPPAFRGLAADGVALGFMLAIVLVLLGPALTRTDLLVHGVDVRQHYSWELYNQRTLASGHLPLWNPYYFTGFPALADVQTTLFYPPHVALRVLPLPAFLSWSLAFHVFAAGAGMYVLCRQIGVSRWAATAAGIGFLLGGGIAPKLYAGHMTFLYGVAWTPLALGLAIRSVRRDGVLPLPHPGLVLVLACQILSSFLQAVIYSLAVIAAYHVYACVWPAERRWPGRVSLRPLKQLCVLLALAVGLSAFQLLPTARFFPSTGRIGGLSFEQARIFALDVSQLPAILFPFSLGAPDTVFYRDEVTGVWHNMPYVGLLLAAVAPLALVRRGSRRMAIFFLGLGVIVLALALGGSLYRLHHWLLPSLRVPTRLLFLFTMALAALGALGLDGLIALARQKGRRRLLGLGYPAALAAVALWTCVVVLTQGAATTSWLTATILGTSVWLVAVEALGLLAAGALIVNARRRSLWMALIVALVLLECFGFARTLVRFRQVAQPVPARVLGTLDAKRVVTLCGRAVTENQLMDTPVATIGGYNSYLPARHAQFIDLVSADAVPGRPPRMMLPGRFRTASRLDLLGALGVTHLVTCAPVDDGRLDLVWADEPVRIYRNGAGVRPLAFWTCRAAEVEGPAGAAELLGRLFPVSTDARGGGGGEAHRAARPVAAGAVEFVVAGRDECEGLARLEVLDAEPATGGLRLQVTAPRDGFVFVGDHAYPERRAWVDGRETPVHHANLVGSLIRVPAGSHRVEFRYVPTSFYLGCLVSALTLTAWLAVARSGRRR